MKIQTRIERTFTALTVALLLAHDPALAEPTGDAAQGQLKWTPHRAATATVVPQQIQPAEQTASAGVTAVQPAVVQATVPAAPPATVQLPPGVPAIGTAPMRSAPALGLRNDDWSSPNRVPGQPQRSAAAGDTLFGVPVIRSPQGEAGRPILAAERQLPATRQPTGRLGGGLAPRYAAAPANGRGRSERLAMNTDAIPSVMAQRPQVGGLDDTGVPGRIPPGAGAVETIAPPAGPMLESADGIGMPMPDAGTIIETMPGEGMPDGMNGGYDPGMAMGDGELMLGEYPSQLHVESFYDDPYACEDDMPIVHHSGRFCAFLRRFGKPYYGWRWYRDFTASVGVTAFTNAADLGLGGNFGTNEYLNFAMPLWNAFGIGWQAGARGVQTNFNSSTTNAGTTSVTRGGRDQVFITTGLFTRAFEGRGLQGGVVWDYLNDNYFEEVNLAQIRTELSYVWGYHEFGFWGAHNVNDQTIFSRLRPNRGVTASTLDMYCGFYRLQFGDANELKVWGGATHQGDGIVGSILRAPMARSWALEGTFTYVIPDSRRTVDFNGSGLTSSYQPGAWNVSANLVFYPAGRSRRSLASPYRPLFDVADNGNLIRNW